MEILSVTPNSLSEFNQLFITFKNNLCNITKQIITLPYLNKINIIQKNTSTIIEKTKIIFESNIIIPISSIIVIINDLIFFLRTFNIIDNITYPYLDSLIFQTNLMIIKIDFLISIKNLFLSESNKWTIFVQTFLVSDFSNIFSIVVRTYIICLQTQNLRDTILSIQQTTCTNQKIQLQNNIIAIENILLRDINTISYNALTVLLSQLRLLFTFLKISCNNIINNLTIAINNQLQLFILIIPLILLLPINFKITLDDIVIHATEYLISPIQILQILVGQYNIYC